MKRFVFAASIMGMLLSSLCAYNPPASGESLYELSSPRQLTNAASSSGGGIFWAGPESMIVNPALSSTEQRIGLNLAYTAMVNTNGDDAKYGNAFQGGILIPFKWAVFSGYMNGTMARFNVMDLGNSLNLKAGLAKEVTEKISVGANLNTGVFWGTNTDWSLSANLGFLYNYGALGFVKNFRYSASILNLGKNYTNTNLPGIAKKEGIKLSQFPTVCTVKAGAAGLLLSNDNVKLGASLDLSTPLFMNLIADLGLQFSIKDALYLSVAEKLNVAEMVNGHYDFMPSVGLTFRFTFNVKNSDYLNKNGWSQSEMSTNVAWKQKYNSIQMASAGVDLSLGLQDKTPPVIQLWLGDEDFDLDSEVEVVSETVTEGGAE